MCDKLWIWSVDFEIKTSKRHLYQLRCWNKVETRLCETSVEALFSQRNHDPQETLMRYEIPRLGIAGINFAFNSWVKRKLAIPLAIQVYHWNLFLGRQTIKNSHSICKSPSFKSLLISTWLWFNVSYRHLRRSVTIIFDEKPWKTDLGIQCLKIKNEMKV